MIVIPLIEKNGHNYLSPSNFSRYDNMDICEGNLTFDNLITKYASSELPSGVRSRLFLFSKVVERADAAIIIGKRPRNYERMYSPLNDLILFGGNACQREIIDLIDKTNRFLKNLDSVGEVGVDLTIKREKHPLCDVKKILNNNCF